MPDVYSERVALEFHIPGALTDGAATLRRLVPFDFQVIGATASVGTAPVGSNLIFDVVYGPLNTATASLASMWPTNNGSSGAPDNRPTIVAGNLDQIAIPASTYTVAPEGTDPALQGQTTGVSTTYTNPESYPYLAKPDPNFPVAQFAGNQPVFENPYSPISITGETGTTGTNVENVETAGANQMPSTDPAFVAPAGTVLDVKVIQVGSTTAGSDATVTVYIVPA